MKFSVGDEVINVNRRSVYYKTRGTVVCNSLYTDLARNIEYTLVTITVLEYGIDLIKYLEVGMSLVFSDYELELVHTSDFELEIVV